MRNWPIFWHGEEKDCPHASSYLGVKTKLTSLVLLILCQQDSYMASEHVPAKKNTLFFPFKTFGDGHCFSS